MIDAGYSTRAKDIKHYTDFESKIICKLISSPYYIGRAASRKCYSPEVYLKNKRLCKLIDKLRYGGGHRCLHLDGGNAPEICIVRKILDGGNAPEISIVRTILDLGNSEIICDNHHNSSDCCP